MDSFQSDNMLFDTHSHVYFDALKEREDEVVRNMAESGVAYCVQIGCDLESSLESVRLARKYPHFYATVAYHPTESQNLDVAEIPSVMAALESIVREHRDRVVAIGETGLDFFHLDDANRDSQIERQLAWFRAHAELARKFDLPIVIHTRNAGEATIRAIREFGIERAVIHCFSEDIAFARELMAHSDGILFGFSGILTYKSARNVQEAASLLPLDRILVETDAPFLAPTPKRGETNEPAYVAHVMETLKTLRSEDGETVEKTVFENSKRFYGMA